MGYARYGFTGDGALTFLALHYLRAFRRLTGR